MSAARFTPDPSNWTLRFKFAKSTCLLHVNPDSNFNIIKLHLLKSLQTLPPQTQIMQAIGDLPSDPGDIVFGAPVEKNRLEEGWVPLEIENMGGGGGGGSDEEMSESEKAGSKKRANAKLRDQLDSTPRNAGLRDGSVLAFTFRSRLEDDLVETNWGVEIPKVEEEEELDGAERK